MVDGICSQGALAQLFLLQLLKVQPCHVYILYVHVFMYGLSTYAAQTNMQECVLFRMAMLTGHEYCTCAPPAEL